MSVHQKNNDLKVEETGQTAVTSEQKSNNLDAYEDIDQLIYTLFNALDGRLNQMAVVLQQLHTAVGVLQEIQDAQLQLLDAKQEVSRKAIIDLCNQKRMQTIQQSIQRDIDSGIIEKVEKVESGEDYIYFKKPDILGSFMQVEKLEDPVRFVGKKAGDVVGDITIIDVYRIKQKK